MSLNDDISRMIDEEVNRRFQAEINTYIEKISKIHGISIELLVRDLPTHVGKNTNDMICKGIKLDGKRCTRKGKFDGYCANHLHQSKKIEPVEIKRSNTHTHSLSEGYTAGCPGCEIGSKRLGDLSTMLCNE